MELGAGQVAVVTGAASGIGLAMARRFAADGLKVVLADVEEGALEKAASALREDGAEVYARVVDVSEREQLDALAAETYEKYGAVHVLCNNAGVGSGAEGRMCAYATARTPRCPWRPWSPRRSRSRGRPRTAASLIGSAIPWVAQDRDVGETPVKPIVFVPWCQRPKLSARVARPSGRWPVRHVRP